MGFSKYDRCPWKYYLKVHPLQRFLEVEKRFDGVNELNKYMRTKQRNLPLRMLLKSYEWEFHFSAGLLEKKGLLKKKCLKKVQEQ